MKRKYLDDLVKWLTCDKKKPLIVWGASRVGKTYLIKNLFAEKYFKDSYIYIDCLKDKEFTSFVKSSSNVEDIIKYLSLKYNKDINKDVLLIFDNAQECTSLVTALKYFNQNHPEIPVILTGSYLKNRLKRIYKDKKYLFPIGNINELTIYPLDFEEYLINKNKIAYEALLDSFNSFTPLNEQIHQMILAIFNEYLLIGGMPEAVETYLKTNSLLNALNVLKDLYSNYLYDMELYQASHESLIRSKSVFKNIFTLLNRESKNFSPSIIETKTRNRDYINPIEWLEMAFIVNKSHQLKDKITLPLLEDNESLFRLYLSDVGMFSLQSSVTPESFILKDAANTLSGVFYENYVATELINFGYPLYYWKGKNNAEFEFIIQYKNSVIPIDVKKSRGKLNSLDAFIAHNKYKFAIKVSANNLGYDETKKIITIPYYMVFALLKKLKNNEL